MREHVIQYGGALYRQISYPFIGLTILSVLCLSLIQVNYSYPIWPRIFFIPWTQVGIGVTFPDERDPLFFVCSLDDRIELFNANPRALGTFNRAISDPFDVDAERFSSKYCKVHFWRFGFQVAGRSGDTYHAIAFPWQLLVLPVLLLVAWKKCKDSRKGHHECHQLDWRERRGHSPF